MRTKLVWLLVQVAPVAASVMGMAAFAVGAAEVPSSLESDRSPTTPAIALPAESVSAESIELSTQSQIDQIQSVTQLVTPKATDDAILSEPIIKSSNLMSSIFTESLEKTPETTNVIFHNWTSDESNIEWKISNSATSIAAFSTEDQETENYQPSEAATPNSIQLLLELEHLTSNRENPSDETQPARLPVSNIAREVIANASLSATEIQLIPILPSDLEQLTLEHWQIAQAESSPESDGSDAAESVPEPEATSHSPRWHVTFTPYGFVPLSVDGSATVRDFTADFNLGLDDILSPLNFAAAGRIEAWRGNLGFIFDGAYFNVGQENSRSRSIPNCLCNIFPSEIETEVNVQYGQFDLGVGYRVGANLSNAATEFDMGPLVFDAIVGIRIYTLHQEIDLSTNIGTDRNLENSNTIVTPLASGRFRWNLSPKLAGWVRGDIAGFGIGGTLMAASVTGGIDWMFSGNTSLLLAYRISSLQYNTDVRGEDFDLDLLLQGPYMGIVFRF